MRIHPYSLLLFVGAGAAGLYLAARPAGPAGAAPRPSQPPKRLAAAPVAPAPAAPAAEALPRSHGKPFDLERLRELDNPKLPPAQKAMLGLRFYRDEMLSPTPRPGAP